MKYIQNKLGRQLMLMILIIFEIIIITLGFLLPKFLTPIYEKNIYNSLKGPLEVLSRDIATKNITTDVAYLYRDESGIYQSKNFTHVIAISPELLFKKVAKENGTLEYEGKTYFYSKNASNNVTKLAITSENYMNTIRYSIFHALFPILFFAFAFILLIVFFWSRMVVKKIEKLKQKIDNIDNEQFAHQLDFKTDDEINSLAQAIEQMRISLINQEKYKNQMYQNISHDFKTPLTVIKSYIEAVDDGVETKENAFLVIKEQTNKLETKVHSLLYLNKLDYLKEQKKEKNEEIDIQKIIDSSIEKMKHQRKDVVFKTMIDQSKFYGTDDLWESIIDNLLNNFIRYAKKEIKITIKNGKIILYNDGPNIDESLLNNLFNPFKKGMKGQFGLGLSIVKKTLNLLNYDITIKNHSKRGVSFIIEKQ